MSTPPRKRIKTSQDSSEDEVVPKQGQTPNESQTLAKAREAARKSMASRREQASGSGSGRSSTNDDDLNTVDGEPIRSTSNISSSSLPRALPPYTSHPTITQCSSIHNYERLNHIEEGSYGIVFRARHIPSGDIVAIKRLKMDRERNGFPITSLREIRTLLMTSPHHPNIVHLREVVVGDTLTQIYLSFEFVEHDLRTLLTHLETPFLLSEIKTLMKQLLGAVGALHDHWIVHRDLKTSNLLLSNRGCLKLADFGLARLYGDAGGGGKNRRAREMTELVVTLWYRAPELLLGAKEYDTAIDMWSVGCIFAEMLLQEPLFPGKNEADQIQKIFKTLGQPTASTSPYLTSLPLYKSTIRSTPPHQPYSLLSKKFPSSLSSTSTALDLLHKLLDYNPSTRLTAHQALQHPWFDESPKPAHPDSFGSFPSVAAGEKRPGRGGGALQMQQQQQPRSPKKERSASGNGKMYAMEWDF